MTDTEVERRGRLDLEPALALAALLNVPPPTTCVPLLWHWLHLLDRPAEADLGEDGHPVSGSVVGPPEPGLRRMWAAGSVSVHRRLRYGELAVRRSKVADVTHKEGRSGPLTFVAVRHEYWAADELACEEEQRIVYRAPSTTPVSFGGLPSDGGDPAGLRDWRVDTSPTMLFRFSALTYNAHRIHYDRDYARAAEGYPGLVVHGPLQAILMAEAIRATEPAETESAKFDYRFHSPLFDMEGLLVGVVNEPAGASAKVRSGSGRLTATSRWRAGAASR